MKIAVVFGSPSVEHFGSCVSGTNVANTLSKKYDVKRILIGMDGEWSETNEEFYYDDQVKVREAYDNALRIGKPKWGRINLQKVWELIKDVDVVIPLTHGPYGESGILQGFFDVIGVPYAGPGVEACVIGQNKGLLKELLVKNNIDTPNYLIINANDWEERCESIINEISEKIGYPLFVKPDDGGSSIGITKVHEKKSLKEAIQSAFFYANRVLVEEYIDGYEIECAVIGNNKVEVASYVGEVVPSNDFYDLEAKYIKPSKSFIPAKNINQEVADEIRSIAKKVYTLVMSCGFSRVDFIVDKKTLRPYVMEFTPIPGCTSLSLFPQLHLKSGLSKLELWEKVIDLAFERCNR